MTKAEASAPPVTRAATMTNRERILAIMDRQSPDRVPWLFLGQVFAHRLFTGP